MNMDDYPIDILYGSGELLIEKFFGGRKITFALSQGCRVVGIGSQSGSREGRRAGVADY